MNSSFKIIRAVLVVIIFVWSFTNCSNFDYNRELIKLKKKAQISLSDNIDEFNNYKGRPAADGPIDLSNNEIFLHQNIPLLLSSDEKFNKVYNYRWWMVSKHLKEYYAPDDHNRYWVFTEFFGVMGWASRSGAISCPAGHQFYETRWLRDPQYLRSYAEFYLGGSGSRMNQRENANFATYISRPESHHYSSWMVDGTEAFLKVHPDAKWRDKMIPHLESHQQVWDSLFTVQQPGSITNGMYKFLDLYDGMEFSIGAAMGLVASTGSDFGYINDENWRDFYLGWHTTRNLAQKIKDQIHPKAYKNGYPQLYLVRPTLNCYSYGNYQALANLYNQKAKEESSTDAVKKSTVYQVKADELKTKILCTLWNDEDQFFNSFTAGDNSYGIRDYEARVRESVGYTPWYFNMLPKDEEKYNAAWNFFQSEKGFNNIKGMTTAEIKHPYYNENAYAWNGRGWPFQNSVVNKAYANYLKNYKAHVTPSDRELLYDYIEKLVLMHGDQPNIGEWYIPSNGEEFGGVKDYFHSSFVDMLIEDLLGFTSSHNEEFTLQSLLPDSKWDYFYLGNIRYHQKDIDIVWKKDWDVEKEGNQSQLVVWVDDKIVAQYEDLNFKMKVDLK
ncbi:MAG: hypothetical protein N4A71_02075 [Carboxylicivirga sp.]|jgi:hypothetical protein|nr:hypothetical protein [Carboxylicivirga sp.]